MTDGLSTLYRDLLVGSYDCVDRIVLNAYFRMGHDPGGFRVWWRALTGSDETSANPRPLSGPFLSPGAKRTPPSNCLPPHVRRQRRPPPAPLRWPTTSATSCGRWRCPRRQSVRRRLQVRSTQQCLSSVKPTKADRTFHSPDVLASVIRLLPPRPRARASALVSRAPRLPRRSRPAPQSRPAHRARR